MTVLTIALIVLLVVSFPFARRALRAYRRWRGTRIVTCPETGRLEAVEVDALRAASTAIEGKQELDLKVCSRWPEREDCAQLCLGQIEDAPAGCLLRNILQQWYDDKVCAFCKRPFGEIQWHDHKPGLLDREGRTWLWADLPAERLAGRLSDSQPVCWDCHVAQEFRRRYPEMVTDRDW